jgi:molecular chaperone GrpE
MQQKQNNAKTSKKEGQKEQEDRKQIVSLRQEEYQKLRAEAAKAQEYQDKILRLQAEFENSRKRLERDKQEFLKYATEGIILRLLNILDDLERAVELAQGGHQDLKVFLKGIEMILAHLYGLLREQGLTPIEAEGKAFNPHLHEALMQVEAEMPENTVVEELQKGYLLKGKVIRTAKVKVARKPEIKGQNSEVSV